MKKKKQALGLHKSPKDERDYLAAPFLLPSIYAIPTHFDCTGKMTPVRNQGSEGSCVGFAMSVGVKEYQEQLQYGKYIPLSPRYVYEYAKAISGHKEGTTLKAAMQVVYGKGVCEEKHWPYTANKKGVQDDKADKNAAKYKVKGFARVRNIDELKLALVDSRIGPTLIGVMVYKGMVSEPCNSTGIVPNPSCWDRRSPLGGHALCAVGYNDNSPYFKNDGHIKVKNSWGEKHGDKGYLYLSYKYIKNNMLDCYTCIDITDEDKIHQIGELPEWEKK
jgi:hypothetical protein